MTKVYFLGCVALSELAVFPIAPILFVNKYAQLKSDGLIVGARMLFGMMAAVCLSSWYFHAPFAYFLKTFAVWYSVFAYYVVMYALLRDDYKGLGWFFLGVAISSIIIIFGFNPQAMVSDSGFGYIGEAEMEDTINHPLFWVLRIDALGRVPIIMSYLGTPLLYSILMPLGFVGAIFFITVTGRSASIAMMVAASLIILGRKSYRSMASISKHIVIYAIVGIALVFAYKAIYSGLAQSGVLGELAQNKYERQTRQGNSLLKMLMAGRCEFFTALRAAVDQPIMGFGPYAEDTKGYRRRFVYKYGDEDDLKYLLYVEQMAMEMGFKMPIPTHSHIMGSWIHNGIFGLIFWLWVLKLMIGHLRFRLSTIPQWFGYFALMIPAFFWDIFFSPLTERAKFAMFLVCLLLARSIHNGKLRLTIEMQMEAEKHA